MIAALPSTQAALSSSEKRAKFSAEQTHAIRWEPIFRAAETLSP
jgi:hypothetical protein